MSDVKRCAACRKEKPVSEMKTCMHAEMHYYVCDSKCMHDFYNPPKAEKPSYDALLAERDQLRAERDSHQRLCIAEMEKNSQLRAELEAIRGQQVVDDLACLVRRLVHHLRKAAPAHDLPEKAMDYLKRKGLQGSPYRAEVDASAEPDAVIVPMELLQRVVAVLGSQGFSAWNELAAEVLLTTKTDGVV